MCRAVHCVIGAGLLLCASVALLAADEPAALYREAVDRQRAGDLAGAAQLYRECLREDPSNIQARSNLGAALSGLGRYDEAIQAYEEALQSAPVEVRPYLERNAGLAYYKSGRLTEAARVFSELHASQPENRDITLLAADCEMQLGEPAKAVELLRPLAISAAQDKAVAYVLGMALLKSGNAAEGQRVLDPILSDTTSAEGNFAVGVALFMGGDFPKAIKAFDRAVALNPKLLELYSYYGRALLYSGDRDAAAEAFRKQLAVDPNDYEANFNLAEIFASEKKFADAAPLLRRAVLLRPQSEQARLALSATLAGRFDRAPARQVGIQPGRRAAAMLLERADGSGRAQIPEAAKASVLVFGSYTCPLFRGAAPALEKLAARYSDRVKFWLVYIREAHPAGDAQAWQSTINEREGVLLAAPANIGEKQEYARTCSRKLHLSFPAVVDGMDNAAEKAYEAWPSRVYVIGADGFVKYASGLGDLEFDAEALEGAIRGGAKIVGN